MARPREFDEEAVLDAATDRFWLRGYEATSIRDLAACTGLTGASLYNAFGDGDHKGCLLVNTALDVAPHDPEFREIVAAVLLRIESLFREKAEAGIADGSIAAARPAGDLARHLLGVLMGIRVLARVRPEAELLEGIVRSVALLFGEPVRPARLS